MTRFITIVVVLLAVYCGWKLHDYWEKNRKEREAAAMVVNPRSLPGMPEQWKAGLENALDQAQRHGATGLREWLKAYRKYVADPRLAWIELDYCVLVAPDNPVEAKRIFNEVKERTPPTSPIYPRLKQLEKTYE